MSGAYFVNPLLLLPRFKMQLAHSQNTLVSFSGLVYYTPWSTIFFGSKMLRRYKSFQQFGLAKESFRAFIRLKPCVYGCCAIQEGVNPLTRRAKPSTPILLEWFSKELINYVVCVENESVTNGCVQILLQTMTTIS